MKHLKRFDLYESLKPLSYYIGENPKVDVSARNWNEEAFLMDGSEPHNVSNVIFETPFKRSYFGGMLGKDIMAKEVYAVADDKLFPGRKLLVMKYVSQNPKELNWGWGAVGEYDGENLGILLAYRNKGVGTAFVKWLMKNNVLKKSIGYSPEGLKTIKKAYSELYNETH